MRSHTNYGRYLSTVIEFADTHTDPQIGEICGVSNAVVAGIRRKHFRETGVKIPQTKCDKKFKGNQYTKTFIPPKKNLLSGAWV